MLYLDYSQGNNFTSDTEPFDPVVDGPYRKNQEDIFDVVLVTLKDQGLAYDHRFSTITIDGVEFKVFVATLLTPDREQKIADMAIFDALVGDISVTISYVCMSEQRRDEIHRAILASTFNP